MNLVLCLAAIVLVFNGALPVQGATTPLPVESKLAASLQASLSVLPAGEKIAVIVSLHGALNPQTAARTGRGATRQERLIRGLADHAKASQKDIRAFLAQEQLAGQVGKVVPFWITNGLSVEASPALIHQLAARTDVARIEPVETFQLPAFTPAAAPGWDHLGKINAPQVWALGFRGQGVVVANLDSGVDFTHPELQAGWRGGTNSWYDPYNQHATPTDLCAAKTGHGTATMGVMVGKTVGVAPDAQWIAVKIFDDTCTAYMDNILLGYQWVLDPDGNPATQDAPQVVNNSWGGNGCDLSMAYQSALQALRAANILPIFSAGNTGAGSATINYPGNYPEAFAVGATNKFDQVSVFSSRGPNQCVQPAVISPALVAPGESIETSSLGGLVTQDGTSFAAPHVAGALALLISAFPQGLPLALQEQALTRSAVPLGAQPAPNNDYGYGRLDVLAAYQSLLPQLSVIQNSVSVLESGGPLSVTLRLDPAYDQPVTVSFAANDATGQGNGVDYTLPPSVTFASGQTQKDITVEITDDALAETDETFLINVVNPPNARIDPSAAQIMLTILDEDPWLVMLPVIFK